MLFHLLSLEHHLTFDTKSFELGAEMRMDACREETDPSDCKFEHWGTWPDPSSVQGVFSCHTSIALAHTRKMQARAT